jgi:hypothetical protein
MIKLELTEKLLQDPKWRMNNLYYVINKQGKRVQFKLNWVQQKLHDEMWYNNIILKARQLGISTFVCLFFLDRCLFRNDVSAGIIAHTRSDAEQMFKRIKYAYMQLPEELKLARTFAINSAREMVFNNQSSLRVGVSLRSSTLQYLHISEFGKICAQYPNKAREIVSGSLNTIGKGQFVFIESTAEGRDGHFYEMSKIAETARIAKKKLTTLDYKFHFYPWFEDPDYRIESSQTMPKELEEYFESLSVLGIKLDQKQKNWYHHKLLVQRDDMKREYPSTPDEAWDSSVEGSFYIKWVREARAEGRIGNVYWEKDSLVYVAFDPGFDNCAVVFWQMVGQEIHVIDFYENSGEGWDHYLSVIKKKPYLYGQYYGPHDINSHEKATGLSVADKSAKVGINLVRIEVASVDEGIEAVRSIFPRLWIDERNCTKLIKCLENYRKEWDKKHLIYKNRAVHNEWSHGADAFRYLATAIRKFLSNDATFMNDEQAEKLYDKYNPIFPY